MAVNDIRFAHHKVCDRIIYGFGGLHLAPSYQSDPDSADLSAQTFIGTTNDRPPFKVEVLFDPLALAVDIYG